MNPTPLPSVSPAAARRPRWSSVSGRVAAAGLAALAVVALAGGPASALVGQDPVPTTTAATPTTAGSEPGTAADVTVDPTPGAATETTAAGDADRTTGDTSEIDEENRKFAMIVAGLVAVAVALALLTIRYWRATRPVRPQDAKPASRAVVDDLDDDDLFVSTAPSPRSPPTAPPVAAAPVEEPSDPAPRRRGRRSRRAVAGADHADVDAGWEPMATGEQERVSGQVPRATNRPSSAQRARALEGSDEG